MPEHHLLKQMRVALIAEMHTGRDLHVSTPWFVHEHPITLDPETSGKIEKAVAKHATPLLYEIREILGIKTAEKANDGAGQSRST